MLDVHSEVFAGKIVAEIVKVDESLSRSEAGSLDEAFSVIGEILGGGKVFVLGTSGKEGPWVASAYFAEEGTRIYCLLTHGTRTLENSKNNPSIAFCVDRQVPDKFLQGRGIIEPLPDESEEKKKGESLLLKKIPEIAGFMKEPTYTICRVTPSELFVTDFSRGWFPAKVVEVE
ncbi:MAG: pyridoxamine 5'-phosphate oxidase family protein [Thermoplasmata archaeon]